MIDKIISAFFAVVTAVMMLFYTPTPVTVVSPEKVPEAKITQDITVMSYNVYIKGSGEKSPENRTPLVAENIKKYSPDSFGLQEADEGWMERLPAIMTDYAYVGIGRDSDEGGGEASPIFYKKDKYELLDSGTFWLSKTPEKASRGWDAMFKRVCTFAILKDKQTGFTYAHFNAHFDHLGVIARLESVAVVAAKIAEIAPGLPVVFSGDLNDYEGGDMYNRVLESGLKDTKYLAEAVSGGNVTYHGYSELVEKAAPIDFIFTNALSTKVQSYAVVSEEINGIYASDHHPVVATMTMING
ncbi:MAG: endonuclease/exonuclease/phosphatase family protein [Clostridia bacterium]|nr:endonuclease/exonuclease/phosphatase family protein [Clostridia bacterium]